MYLADLHLHTDYSDGTLSMHNLVDLMGQNGMGAIAITDHLCEKKTFLGKSARLLGKTLNAENFDAYLNEIYHQSRRAWNEYGMLVLPGVEITKNSFSHKGSAHILAVNIQKYIDPDQPIVDILNEIRAQGGISIAAHPVHTGYKEHQTYQLWNERERLASHFDAWEVASGNILFKEVQNSGLPVIANSDLHRPQQIESWKTAFFGEKSAAGIKQSLLQQEIQVHYFYPLREQKALLKKDSTSAYWPDFFPAKI